MQSNSTSFSFTKVLSQVLQRMLVSGWICNILAILLHSKCRRKWGDDELQNCTTSWRHLECNWLIEKHFVSWCYALHSFSFQWIFVKIVFTSQGCFESQIMSGIGTDCKLKKQSMWTTVLAMYSTYDHLYGVIKQFWYSIVTGGRPSWISSVVGVHI